MYRKIQVSSFLLGKKRREINVRECFLLPLRLPYAQLNYFLNMLLLKSEWKINRFSRCETIRNEREGEKRRKEHREGERKRNVGEVLIKLSLQSLWLQLRLADATHTRKKWVSEHATFKKNGTDI